MKDKNQFVDLNNARPGVYREVIEKIQKSAICPFCPEHIRSIHKNPIIERKNWLVTDNAYPYKPTKKHLLLIHKKHIEFTHELTNEAWLELWEILREETKKLSAPNATLVLRFGATKDTGASVTHLHCHIVQSDPNDPNYDKKVGVLTRIG